MEDFELGAPFGESFDAAAFRVLPGRHVERREVDVAARARVEVLVRAPRNDFSFCAW